MTLLKIKNISKEFPGVRALNDVTIDVHQGEVHALCGENGAGKSTLMNILSGNLHPDSGEILLNSKKLHLKNPRAAFQEGISIVHQHLSLVDSLSIAENIFANQQPTNTWGFIQFKNLYRASQNLLKELNIDLNPRTLVGKLPAAQRQMVEISKALAKKPKILILDEPTASVTDKEVKTLFRIIAQQKQEKVTIIYISHRLNEIFEVADRVTVLKDGILQGTYPVSQMDRDQLIRLMVGRDIAKLKYTPNKNQELLLETRDLSNEHIQGLNIRLRKGEILGMAGLIGAGRSEIARMIFGADPPTRGELWLSGEKISVSHPRDAIKKGIVYLPEDRKAQSLFPHMTIEDNLFSSQLVYSNDWVRKKGFREKAGQYVQKLRIASPTLQKLVAKLSGGNQQKVFLARWLLKEPHVLIVDEPTHGIDIGTKFDFYQILKQLADEGKGVIVISSELTELLGLCDNILVVRQGRISGILSHAEATEEKILRLAMVETA